MGKLHVCTDLDITEFGGKTLLIVLLSDAETVKLLEESNKCNTLEEGVDCLLIKPGKNFFIEVE